MQRRSTYPPEWQAISHAIRYKRARGTCESCGLLEGETYPGRDTVVHLACAHLGLPLPDGRLGDRRDKSDCRPENLAALCQRCHLNLDRADHQARRSANYTRRTRERLAARGLRQLELFLYAEPLVTGS